jgi:hypothetical protein
MAKYVDRLRHERHAKVSTPRGKPGSPFSHGFRFAQKIRARNSEHGDHNEQRPQAESHFRNSHRQIIADRRDGLMTSIAAVTSLAPPCLRDSAWACILRVRPALALAGGGLRG